MEVPLVWSAQPSTPSYTNVEAFLPTNRLPLYTGMWPRKTLTYVVTSSGHSIVPQKYSHGAREKSQAGQCVLRPFLAMLDGLTIHPTAPPLYLDTTVSSLLSPSDSVLKEPNSQRYLARLDASAALRIVPLEVRTSFEGYNP